MAGFQITFDAYLPDGQRCLVPAGITTPYGQCVEVEVNGAIIETVAEAYGGQRAHVVTGRNNRLSLRFHFDEAEAGAYPEIIFDPNPTRYTRFADTLVAEVAEIAPELRAQDRARAIACATAERFTYGHPEEKFNDGMDTIPALGCGLTEGSCVDINTYFIASLRAAGIEAGYVTGFYFPAEKGDWCEDGHCWVVTRTNGVVEEWDIAHHLKLGTCDIHPGLNPKPGFRAAVCHSMGLNFAQIGVSDLKALIEPLALTEEGPHGFEAPEIRLVHPAVPALSSD